MAGVASKSENGVFGFCIIKSVQQTNQHDMPFRDIPLGRVALLALSDNPKIFVGGIRGGGCFSTSYSIPWTTTVLVVDGKVHEPSGDAPVTLPSGDFTVKYGNYVATFVEGQNLINHVQ